MPLPQEIAGVDKDLFNSTGAYVGLDAIKSHLEPGGVAYERRA